MVVKKTRYFIFFVLISMFSYAQSGPNPFAEKESESAFDRNVVVQENDGEKDKDITQKNGGGNPGDPVPIDNYIPLLIITAVGIMVYHTRQRKKMSA